LDSEDPQPPPLQPADAEPVPYFAPHQGRGWVAIATFSTIGRWHAANAVLSRNGIAGKMGETSADGDTQMLVPATEFEWACELLGIANPLAAPPLAATAEQSPRKALPVDIRVQPKSDTVYFLIRTMLILAMVFVAVFTIMAAIFWQ